LSSGAALKRASGDQPAESSAPHRPADRCAAYPPEIAAAAWPRRPKAYKSLRRVPKLRSRYLLLALKRPFCTFQLGSDKAWSNRPRFLICYAPYGKAALTSQHSLRDTTKAKIIPRRLLLLNTRRNTGRAA